MTKALDYFDPAKEINDNLSEAFINAKSKFSSLILVNWRFPVARSKEITDALVQVHTCSTSSSRRTRVMTPFFFQLIVYESDVSPESGVHQQDKKESRPLRETLKCGQLIKPKAVSWTLVAETAIYCTLQKEKAALALV